MMTESANMTGASATERESCMPTSENLNPSPVSQTANWRPIEEYCHYKNCVFYYPPHPGDGHPSNARPECFSVDGPWPNRPPSHFMELYKP